MPLEHRTRGLVLRTFDQGESDRVVHLYTEKLGRIGAIAKGARRSKRRFPGTLEILSLVDARLVEPPRAALLRLEAAKLERAFEEIPASLGRFAVACQFLELLDRLTAERESLPDLFHFAVGVLDVLCEEPPDRLLAVLVLAKTLARLGYRPQLVACAICGGELPAGASRVAFSPAHGGAVCPRCTRDEAEIVPTRVLRALEAGLRRPLRARGTLGFDARGVDTAERLIDRFFRFHIGFELRSAAFLRSALEDAPAVDAARDRGDTAPASDPDGASAHDAPERLESDVDLADTDLRTAGRP